MNADGTSAQQPRPWVCTSNKYSAKLSSAGSVLEKEKPRSLRGSDVKISSLQTWLYVASDAVLGTVEML